MDNTSFILTAKGDRERVKEITEKLEAGIQGIFESEQYKAYLTTLAKFHHYSFNNTLAIALQRPDATRVAGFGSWRDNFKRNVKKDEKGIKILAPAPYKTTEEIQQTDPDTGQPLFDSGGQPITTTREVKHPAFKVVSVFDVSQTDGEPLPEIGVDELTGSVEHYGDFFAALKAAAPVPIGFENITSGANGYYHYAEKRIAVREDMSELQTLKTTIHEIAHARLHDKDLNAETGEETRTDRSSREVEAESVAYTVCQHYGLDTSDYSFGYVAAWSGSKELATLKSSLEVIRNEADSIIKEVDGHFAKWQKKLEAVTSLDGQKIIRENDGFLRYDNGDVHSYLLPGDTVRLEGKEITAAEAFGAENFYGQEAMPTLTAPEHTAAEQLPVPTPTVRDFATDYYNLMDARNTALSLPRFGADEPHIVIANLVKEIEDGADIADIRDTIETALPQFDILNLREQADALLQRLQAFENVTPAITAEENELLHGEGDRYGIYQLTTEEGKTGYIFEPFHEAAGQILRDDYTLMYTAPLAPGDTPESLYDRHNMDDRPAGQTMRSMGMSDILIMKRGKAVTSFYTDRFGFQPITGFLEREAIQPIFTMSRTGRALDRVYNTLTKVLQDDNRNVKTIANAYNDATRQLKEISAAIPDGHRLKEYVDNAAHAMDSSMLEAWMKIIHAELTEMRKAELLFDGKPFDPDYLKAAEMSTEQNYNMIDGVRNNTEPNVVEIRSACNSNYTGMVALVGEDGNVYLGKRGKYDNMGHYYNNDNSLTFITDNRDIYPFLYGEGWLASQRHMIQEGYHTPETYGEWSELKAGVLAQFTEIREILFNGEPFKAPNHAPTMAEIEADVAAGKPVALMDIVAAQKNERKPPAKGKKASLLGRLDEGKKTVAQNKDAGKDKSRKPHLEVD